MKSMNEYAVTLYQLDWFIGPQGSKTPDEVTYIVAARNEEEAKWKAVSRAEEEYRGDLWDARHKLREIE
jgi:hypothetical protein